MILIESEVHGLIFGNGIKHPGCSGTTGVLVDEQGPHRIRAAGFEHSKGPHKAPLLDASAKPACFW